MNIATQESFYQYQHVIFFLSILLAISCQLICVFIFRLDLLHLAGSCFYYQHDNLLLIVQTICIIVSDMLRSKSTITSFVFMCLVCFFKFNFIVIIRTVYMKSTLLTDFKVHNTILLTGGTRLYSRSLESIHFSLLKFYTLWLSAHHFHLVPTPGNDCSVLCFYDYFRHLI